MLQRSGSVRLAAQCARNDQQEMSACLKSKDRQK